jgi:hypothetical protein
MFLVRHVLGMLAIALCVIGAMPMQPDCPISCGTLASVQWDVDEILPGIAGLFGGVFAFAIQKAGALRPAAIANGLPP